MHFTLNSPVFGLRAVSVFTGLGSLVHLARLFIGSEIVINGLRVPVWVSGVAMVVLGLVSFWFWRLSTHADPAAPASPTRPVPAKPATP